MKKYLLSGLLATLTLGGATYAQNAGVPAAAKTTFAKLYPQAKGLKWDKENGGYEASFTEKGKAMSLLFDTKGALKETETDIAVTELPAAIRDYVAKQMPGKKIKEAAIIVDASGTKKYEAEVGGKDLMFDMVGKPLK
ncbi:MAG: PepSY-like domain-containing protein [Spirosoma sp.]|nr:PepSY-like domain-containing protein [Spirosoma sp.]